MPKDGLSSYCRILLVVTGASMISDKCGSSSEFSLHFTIFYTYLANVTAAYILVCVPPTKTSYSSHMLMILSSVIKTFFCSSPQISTLLIKILTVFYSETHKKLSR
jgi:hypothetical protein